MMHVRLKDSDAKLTVGEVEHAVPVLDREAVGDVLYAEAVGLFARESATDRLTASEKGLIRS